METARKKIIYAQAKRLDVDIELRFTKMVNDLIEHFGSFTTADFELFHRYIEHEQDQQGKIKAT